MSKNEKCITKVIEDIPSEEDLLGHGSEIGPHKRVANAITEIILSKEDTGGKMVGIEGGWGSGKSTVINLLKKEILPHDEIYYHYFDAWAHEGDPLRRTFLESLIKGLKEKAWINNNSWNNTLEELAKRRKVTTTKTIPKATWLGKSVALSLFVVPIGMSLLTAAIDQGVTIDSEQPFSLDFIFGLILAGSPLIPLFINFLIVIFGKKRGTNEKIDNWAFLVGESISEVNQETTETPEPTSIEFEAMFNKLMAESLSPNPKRQSVIILDNLDRVDSKYALSIWSTLQTFLQYKGSNNIHLDWFKKLWIIIPYDPKGLSSLWKDDQNVTSSFIDKSFQLRFEVPPLVLSNWKHYLISLLKLALPNHTDEVELNQVYTIYSRMESERAPTPRELKLFVNQVGVIHRQWQHKFPLSHVAYYVLLKKMQSDIRSGLRLGTIPDERIKGLLPINLKENLAGLYFNVESTTGQQLLLSDPIKGALVNNDPKSLLDLKKIHTEGFWAVLDENAHDIFNNKDGAILASIATCLKNSNIFQGETRYETKKIIINLERSATEIKEWTKFDSLTAQGIISLCQLVLNKDFSSKIIKDLRTSLKSIRVKDGTQDKNELIDGIIQIIIELEKLGHSEVLTEPFTLPLNSSDWIFACATTTVNDSKIWSLIKPLSDLNSIISQIEKDITAGLFNKNHLNSIKIIDQSFSGLKNWDLLSHAVRLRLNANQPALSPEVGELIQCLYLLGDLNSQEAKIKLSELAREGHLMHFLHQVNAEGKGMNESIVWCMIAYLEVQPTFPQPPAIGNSISGYKLMNTFLASEDKEKSSIVYKTLESSNKFKIILNVINERGSVDPLILECLKLSIESRTIKSHIAYEFTNKWWAELKNKLNNNDNKAFEKLISLVIQNTEFIQHLTEDKFSLSKSSLYKDFIVESKSQSEIIQWCIEGLSAITSQDWLVELNENRESIYLIDTVIKSGKKEFLRTEFQDALVEHSKSLIKSTVEPPQALINIWSNILDALELPLRKMLLNKVIEEAMEADGQLFKPFFQLYSSELSDYETLSRHPKIIEKIFSPLVKEQSIHGLIWLEQIIHNNGQILTNKDFDEDALHEFKRRIEEELKKRSQEPSEFNDLIIKIGTHLGLMINPNS